MELKNYQRNVLANIRSFLRHYRVEGDAAKAYRAYLADEGLVPGRNDIPDYCDGLGGIPDVCVKVPTGGGKTFIAANALDIICEELPERPADVVVWLVPRKEILAQTLRHLRDTSDPLRMVLDRDFAHCVEVLDKEDGLRGRGFTSSTVTDQLTLFVLSYDSFKNKDGRRAYAENSQLVQLTQYQRKLGLTHDIEGADDTSLISALAGTNPIVIVDESHHAGSKLSQEMLRNLNPRFVLELTATPRDTSNVISRVPALSLKHEEMVKLPVIVYRRNDKGEVLQDAILLQRKLEKVALDAESKSGDYIRPIVLLQAQSNTADDSETYDRLKSKLLDAGIPAEQIAIRTGNVDEIGGHDLMSRACPIRFIITVEALAEGWDCPFAYVLATVANKSSKTSVEQVVGRILRQPYAHRSTARSLNISYVLTSSSDFNATIEQVVNGLNEAGFSKQDVRVSSADDGGQDKQSEGAPEQTSLADLHKAGTDAADTQSSNQSSCDDHATPSNPSPDTDATEKTSSSDSQASANEADPGDDIDGLIGDAEAKEKDFEADADAAAEHAQENESGLGGDMNKFKIRDEVASSVATLLLPQFRIHRDAGLFSDEASQLFDRGILLQEFDLRKLGTDGLNLNYIRSDNARQVDIDDSDELRVRALDKSKLDEMKKLFARYSTASKRKAVSDGILSSMSSTFTGTYGSKGLKDFLGRVVDQMDPDQVDSYIDNTRDYTRAIEYFIKAKSSDWCRRRFNELLNGIDEDITLEPTYTFPNRIVVRKPLKIYYRSLYEAECGDMNELERNMADSLSNSNRILWWHRVDDKKSSEFCINGFINHYPDFLAMTTDKKILAIETKGEQLKNDDSRLKLELGRTWAQKAGSGYRYFMVFDHDPIDDPLACTLSQFRLDILDE